MARKIKTSLEQLTDLQIKQGFLPNTGILSPIAIFGYIGEAGEVAGELSTPGSDYMVAAALARVTYAARSVDTLKKEIRDKKKDPIEIIVNKPNLLKAELADHFYYMNAVCIELGITHEELAEMALNKELSYLDGKEPNKHIAPANTAKRVNTGASVSYVKVTDEQKTQINNKQKVNQPAMSCSMEDGCISCGS